MVQIPVISLNPQWSSQYICDCGALLYVKMEDNVEGCLNPICENKFEGTIINITAELAENIDDKFKSWTTKSILLGKDFPNYLYSVREEIISSLLSGKPADIERLQLINKALALCKNNRFVERSKSKPGFEIALKELSTHFKNLRMLDDILTSRCLVVTGPRFLILKYSKVFRKVQNNYGLTNDVGLRSGEVFKYESIDSKTSIGSEFYLGMDLLDLFRKLYRLIIQIIYLFEQDRETKKLFDFVLSEHHIAYTLSLWFSVPKGISSVSSTNMAHHLIKQGALPADSSTYFDNIALKPRVTPIIFVTPNKPYLVGHATLFLFTLYLVGKHSPQIIVEGKSAASKNFEQAIRDHLRSLGYVVPRDEGFMLRKNEYEYDIIAYSQETKSVLLIEAKYKDLSPASLTGETLLQNEVLNQGGLKDACEQHTARKSYFIENLQEFGKVMDVDFSDFVILPLIVLKYEPLLSTYGDIELISYDDFLLRYK